jgi:ketosteroid isomerase-like protein
MTSNATRAQLLTRALQAIANGDRAVMAQLHTDDVQAWTPVLSTSSITALATEFDRRDEAFSDIQVEIIPLDVGGDYACAEWSVTMRHSGPLVLSDDRRLEPTGLQVVMHGVTVGEFCGDRICALRQYWDELALLEQLGVVAQEAKPGVQI